MKTFGIIVKILTALAAIAGAVYVIATYGDKIVAWAKKLWASMPCPCCEEAEVAAEEAPAEEVAAEETAEEVPAEPVSEEPAAEIVVEEAAPVAEEAAPVAEEADFEA